MAVSLMNARTREPIATSVEVAVTRRSRRRGLLGRDHLDASAALVLEPCAAVHTAFMRFSIDVVFVNRGGYAVKIVEDVPPWRIALSTRAYAVIEMPAGSLRRLDVSLGDRLYVLPASDSAETMTVSLNGREL
jgi:uncharacterized membrane protein (UPF0127 family)